MTLTYISSVPTANILKNKRKAEQEIERGEKVDFTLEE